MPRFPFYNEEFEPDVAPMADWEIRKRSEHGEIAKHFADYRSGDAKFDQHARRGMRIYNVTQTAKPTDEVSRIFLGLTRTVIDRTHDQMTEGEPGFSFSPRGPSDHKKVTLWEHLIENILSDCNYKAHQNIGFRDMLSMGSTVFEQYCDYPFRYTLVPNDKEETGYERVKIRDFRRPQVGVRAINPLDAWRNPNISNPSDVPSCVKREVYSWNQFAVDCGSAYLQDGSPKYKNLLKIQKGTHVCVFVFQDEITGEYVKYAIGFGNEQDGYTKDVPDCSKISEAIQIFYKPMKIHELRKGKKTLRADGLNIIGKCTLRWGTYFDAYDLSLRGTHSVYGMGIPRRIEAEDMTMQMIFNTNLDNFRWSNAVVLNYEGSNADSYIDADANRFIGGEMVDGKITPQSLGIARIGDYQVMKQDLEEGIVPATGTNYRQMIGDTSKTAFEFGQRLKMSNRSAEQTLTRLESELFKPIGELLLAGALSDMTTEEYEDMTEEQVESAMEMIKGKKATAQDYKDLEGEKPQRKVRKYIRMPGKKFREDFSQSSVRKLDYNSTDNTLIPDASMDVEAAYIPLVEEYVVPSEYIESGLLPDVTVDSKRMLGDMKARDSQNMDILVRYLLMLMEAGLLDPKKIDVDFFTKEFSQFAGVDEDKIIKGDEKEPMMEMAQKAVEAMQRIRTQSPSLSPNVQPVPNINAGASGIIPQGQGVPDLALQRATAGTL